MRDLETRLRAAVDDAVAGYTPSADLAERMAARVRRREQGRRAVAAGVAATALVVVGGAALMLRGPGDGGRVDVVDDPPTTDREATTTSTTTAPTSASTTEPKPPPSTTAVTPPPPTTVPVGPGMPMSRGGLGPVRAGMTLREVEEATGQEVAVPDNWLLWADGTCYSASIIGVDEVWMLVTPAGNERPDDPAVPPADPMDGVVRFVADAPAGTVEGVTVGQTIDEVVAILGPPTGTSSGIQGDTLVFEDGGSAYGVHTGDGKVVGIQAGDPDFVALAEGCS